MFNINMVAKPPLNLAQLRSSGLMQVKPSIGPLSNLVNLGRMVGQPQGDMPGQPQGGFNAQQMGGMSGQQMGSIPGQQQRDFNSQPQNAFTGFNQRGGYNQPQGYGQQIPGQQQRDFNSQPQNAFMECNQPQGGFNQFPQMPQSGFNQSPQMSQQMPHQMPRGGFNSQQTAPKKRNFGNGVILQKGQKTSLSKMCPGLDLIHVGIGWDLGPNGQSYDLDVEAFMLGANGKVIGDDWFVFYNQPDSPDGSVRLLASSTDGAGDGDDEIIQVQLSKVNSAVSKIVFIISINDAKVYGYNFSNIANAYVRVVDMKTGKEITRFQLTDYYENVNSMMVGEVYLHNGEWKFNAIGNGVSADLADLCIRYGVNLA